MPAPCPRGPSLITTVMRVLSGACPGPLPATPERNGYVQRPGGRTEERARQMVLGAGVCACVRVRAHTRNGVLISRRMRTNSR